MVWINSWFGHHTKIVLSVTTLAVITAPQFKVGRKRNVSPCSTSTMRGVDSSAKHCYSRAEIAQRWPWIPGVRGPGPRVVGLHAASLLPRYVYLRAFLWSFRHLRTTQSKIASRKHRSPIGKELEGRTLGRRPNDQAL